ncbi:carboxypeptidase-like regulatory domain-containing protein [Salinimicrobium catena]|uniref:carboxypeptidase-like regulatory domain-containing protein n=1 Tax=Salinimicrobium catena TaxID=390640 RepID=UPI002FE4B88F
MKQFFLIVFLLSSGISVAQFADRREVEGNIKVPKGAETEGITIYNKSSGHGTVSSQKGHFQLKVKAGDSIYFSAVQYGELLVVVDEEIVKTEQLNVEISEGINELPEVVVRPHDLTGNLETDAENIEVVEIELPPMNFNFNDYEMRPDMQSGVENAAVGGKKMRYGVNIFGILEKVVNLVISKKEKPWKAPLISRIELERSLRASYDNAFFEDSFGLPAEQISNFMDFIYEKEFPEELLQKGKDMDRLQYLMEESEEFRNL